MFQGAVYRQFIIKFVSLENFWSQFLLYEYVKYFSQLNCFPWQEGTESIVMYRNVFN